MDPDNPQAFDKKDIKLYYLINGEKQEVFDGRLNHPRNFFIFNRGEELKNSDGYGIRIFANISESDEFPITYVQWNEADTDTIKTKYRRTPNMIVLTKAWYNGKLVYDGETNGNAEPYIQIVK